MATRKRINGSNSNSKNKSNSNSERKGRGMRPRKHASNHCHVILLAGLVMAALVTGACVEREVTQVVYLRPDGSATWTILEREVRSTADDHLKRESEETEYRHSRLEGGNPLTSSLDLLGAHELRTVWLRHERPFAVWTEGSFSSIASLADRLMLELGVVGTAELILGDSTAALEIRVDRLATESRLATWSPSGVEELLLADRFTISLTKGRFVEAIGLELSSDGTEAIPIEPEDPDENGTGMDHVAAAPGPELIYRLVWERDEP